VWFLECRRPWCCSGSPSNRFPFAHLPEMRRLGVARALQIRVVLKASNSPLLGASVGRSIIVSILHKLHNALYAHSSRSSDIVVVESGIEISHDPQA
jgi:hypothetical protein